MDRNVKISGKKLADMRKRHLLTQAEVADALGVTTGRVTQIEAAESIGMYAKNFRKLAEMFKMPVEGLVACIRPTIGKPTEIVLPDLNTDPYSEQAIPEIPTFDMTVAAGGWVEVSADDFGEDVPPGVVRGAQAIALGLFRIRVRGDSMQPAYPDGGVVEFRCLRQGHDGLVVGQDYYVQLSDGTATFKRLHSESDDELVFRALNRRKYPKLLPVPRGLVVRTARVVGRILPPADEQGR